MVEMGFKRNARSNRAHIVVVINHYAKKYLLVQLLAK